MRARIGFATRTGNGTTTRKYERMLNAPKIIALRVSSFGHFMAFSLSGVGRPTLVPLEVMMKTRLILPVLLVAAAFVTPASANWFHNPYQGVNRNIGSAPNPTPADIRENRLPIAAQDEQADPGAVAAAAKDAGKSATPPANTTAQAGGAGVVASASPSR